MSVTRVYYDFENILYLYMDSTHCDLSSVETFLLTSTKQLANSLLTQRGFTCTPGVHSVSLIEECLSALEAKKQLKDKLRSTHYVVNVMPYNNTVCQNN